MRYYLVFTIAVFALSSTGVQARDTKHYFSIKEAMNSPDYHAKLDSDVLLFFGNSPHPNPDKRLGEYVTNKKTNAFGKSDKEACEWVLLSALLSLQKRAIAEGGNAVVNIRSYYKKNKYSSATQYECHAGAFVAGVALKGEVVRLPK
jgi:hypothetical protein